jgi:hypothetical protein
MSNEKDFVIMWAADNCGYDVVDISLPPKESEVMDVDVQQSTNYVDIDDYLNADCGPVDQYGGPYPYGAGLGDYNLQRALRKLLKHQYSGSEIHRPVQQPRIETRLRHAQGFWFCETSTYTRHANRPKLHTNLVPLLESMLAR